MADSADIQKAYLMPETLGEAHALAVKYGAECSFIAGGTDIMLNKQQGNEKTKYFIDLSGIKALHEISVENDMLKIGAMTRLNDLKANETIRSEFSVLIDAVRHIASPAIRNQATLGGNLLCENRCIFYNQSEFWREAAGFCLKCNGDICLATGGKKNCYSKFVSDAAPALISLDAKIIISGTEGDRQITLEELYTGDGVNSKKMGEDDILKYILLPLNRHFKSSFRKLRQRKTLEFTSLTSVATVDGEGSLVIALSGVAPNPVVIHGSQNDDREALLTMAIRKSKIINNDIIPRAYRREMLLVYIEKCLEDIGL